MSAPVKCGTCCHRWSEDVCDGCKVWDPEYELYTAFENYEQGCNEDRIVHISEMCTEEIAQLLSEVCGVKRSPKEWEQWLMEEMK